MTCGAVSLVFPYSFFRFQFSALVSLYSICFSFTCQLIIYLLCRYLPVVVVVVAVVVDGMVVVDSIIEYCTLCPYTVHVGKRLRPFGQGRLCLCGISVHVRSKLLVSKNIYITFFAVFLTKGFTKEHQGATTIQLTIDS